MLHSSTVAANDLKQNVDLLLESDGVEFTLKFFSYDRLKSLVVNCAALTSNKATTRHKKAFRNAIWLWSDFKMHMFCSCYLTADKSLRHTTVQYNVWLWPPLPDSIGAKGKHANLSSQQVLWQRGRPPSPSASAAVEFKLCTLQPRAPARGQTARFRLSMRRHVCDLSGDGVKKCVAERAILMNTGGLNKQGTDISSDHSWKSNNKVQLGDEKHLTVASFRSALCSSNVFLLQFHQNQWIMYQQTNQPAN